MNSPRRSGLPPPPSAGLHPVGQLARLKAMIAQVGERVDIVVLIEAILLVCEVMVVFMEEIVVACETIVASALVRRVLRSLRLLTRAFHPLAVRPLPDHTVLMDRGLFHVAYQIVSTVSVPKNARAESIDFLRKEGVFLVSIEEKNKQTN